MEASDVLSRVADVLLALHPPRHQAAVAEPSSVAETGACLGMNSVSPVAQAATHSVVALQGTPRECLLPLTVVYSAVMALSSHLSNVKSATSSVVMIAAACLASYQAQCQGVVACALCHRRSAETASGMLARNATAALAARHADVSQELSRPRLRRSRAFRRSA